MNPVTTPSLLYPQFGNFKPHKKYYQCPKCQGNMRTRLAVQIVRKEDMVFGFKCEDCGKNWFISSKLILNDILEEQIARVANFTKQTGKEFGAFIVKTKNGIRLDIINIGEDLSVSFKQTHELAPGEKIIGTWHAHPVSNEPSDYDIGSFLHDDFERISIVSGAKGTINVMVKTPDTIQIEDIRKWIEENQLLSLKDKGKMFKFLVFKGKTNNLQLVSGITDNPLQSLESLLRKIE